MRPFEVRPAEPGDLPQLVELCLAARAESSLGPQLCSTDGERLAQQLGALTAAPGGVLLVASAETRLVGLLLGRLVGPNPFTDDVSLTVEALYVDAAHRRRGAGHALMLGATEVAAEADADQVYATPIPGARGMQRFLVQLGFTPAASYRVADTAALQRRLSQDPAHVRRSAPRGLDDLIARRRLARIEARVDPVRASAAGAVGPVVDDVLSDEVLSDDAQAPGRRASLTRHVRRAVQIRRDSGSTTTIS